MGLLQDWGCDGVVVDWSFPEDNKDQYFNLIHTLRMVLDQFEVDFCNVEVMEAGLEGNLARRCRFWVCLGLGWEGLDVWHNIHAIDKIVDVWFYRGHDYSGPWSNTSMHHANLRGKESDSIARNTSMDLNTFFDRGIFPRKVILGLPMYGRSFIQESTEFGSEFNDSGIVFYKDIDPSWDCGFDNHLAAAWCHDGTRLISYDNPSTVKVKTLWAMQDGLAGLSFTPAFGDKPGFDSLLHAAWEQMPTFDGSPSRINFPRSKYPQIRGLLDPQKDFPA